VAYQVELTPQAIDDIASLPKKVQRQVARQIDHLVDDPRHARSKKLKGSDDVHRARFGDYRILYEIQDDPPVVLVVRVRHRRDVYKGLF